MVASGSVGPGAVVRIATKINIGVLTVFAATVIANFAVLEWTIKPKFDEIEISDAKRNHERVLEGIQNMGATLRASAQDYAFWDACFDFARGIDVEKFKESTLSPADKMLENVAVDVAVFFNNKRELIWAAGIDHSSTENPFGLVVDLMNLEYRHPYLSGNGDVAVTSGMIETSKGLALVSVAPIVRSDHTGDPAGVLLMGKLLDEAAIQKLTGVSFRLDRSGKSAKSAEVERTVVTGPDTIASTSLVADIMDRPLALLTSESGRRMSKVGSEAINYAVLLMMLAAALVIMALWLFVRSVIVSRLARLTSHFANAVADGRISEHRTLDANDEIRHLATTFNCLAKQVNDMRDELADSAYLNGLSEWASGTLHNVRNSLMPINMYTQKLQELFSKQWSINFGTAIEQLTNPDTPPERREKLLAYVAASNHHFAHSVDMVQELASNIMSCSKSIEEMVSGHESFAKKDVRKEHIEIRELLTNVAKMTFGSTGSEIEMKLPDQPAFITGNRIILRQIAANIFFNAGEAMLGQKVPKRVSIEFREAPDNGDYLEIAMSDNGEGIPPDKLTAIFARGYSTRQHKKGGLGLHWCANAAKAMGGSLWAESNDTQTGATLVLRLPKASDAAARELAA